MRIDISRMGGEVPKLKPHLLPEGYAEQAKNCHFSRGVIAPRRENEKVMTLPLFAKSLHKYNDNWLLWRTASVSAIDSPIAQDPWQRVYYTGDGKPQVTAQDIATDESGFGPAASYDLGVPRPEIAPTIIGIDDSTGEDPPPGEPEIIDDEDRVYIQTYVTRFGEEGAPGEPSDSVLVERPGSTVTVGLSPPTENTHNITHTRLYRSVSAAGVGEYMLIVELPIATQEYQDKSRNLNAPVLEAWDYDMPPENMQGLCAMANGICAGFAGNEVMFSMANLPYSWPRGYRLTTEHDIQAIASIGTSLVAATKGYPFVFSGVTPDAMTATKLDSEQACVSPESLAVVSGMAMYASPDGLVVVSADGAVVATEQVIEREQWQAMKPETIKAVAVEGLYIAVSDTGAFIFDPLDKSIMRTDDAFTTAYVDMASDSLYLVNNREVSAWQRSDESRRFTWRSKVFVLPIGSNLTCGRVFNPHDESVHVRVIADGETVLARDVSNQPFRLPPSRASRWQVEASGNVDVERIMLASSMQELA